MPIRIPNEVIPCKGIKQSALIWEVSKEETNDWLVFSLQERRQERHRLANYALSDLF